MNVDLSEPAILALVALVAPFLAFILALVPLRSRPSAATAVVLASGAVAAACTVLLLLGRFDDDGAVWRWLDIGEATLTFGVWAWPLSTLMGAIVGVVTLAVQVYSTGYMAHDPGRGRFFALLALFEATMLGFVFAPDLLQTFIFWELVGLASFFLIGFWYQKPDAIAAAKKAFIITRIGDVGLLVGLVLLFVHAHSFDLDEAARELKFQLDEGSLRAGTVELIAALLFVGIIGKSAQFPLHTWLPDAMAGPTPVSALLHSATMVAAGVFLFALLQPVFELAPATMGFALALASFTALFAAALAAVQNDIKRILAYSSISQLGTMLAGLAAGHLTAGMFHLTTHASFKALLFLAAGALIHHFGTQDIHALGRAGARRDPAIAAGLVVGGAALAGVPGFAGFASKEAVLSAVHALPGPLAGVSFAMLILGAAFTAYYVGRLLLIVLRRPDAIAAGSPSASSTTHGHAPTPAMLAAVVLLTLVTLAMVGAGPALGSLFERPLPEVEFTHALPGLIAVAFGLALAAFDFGRMPARLSLLERVGPLHRALRNGFYIDAIYEKAFVGSALAVARALHVIEARVLDAAGDLTGRFTLGMGEGTSRGQSGQLQRYIGVAAVLLAMVALWLGFAP